MLPERLPGSAISFGAVLTLLWFSAHCARLASEDGDGPTSVNLAQGVTPPMSSATPDDANAGVSGPGNTNYNTPPATDDATKPATGAASGSPASFVGVNVGGFRLQNTERPGQCLQALDPDVAIDSLAVMGPCVSGKPQEFYWARGTFCLTPKRCLRGPFVADAKATFGQPATTLALGYDARNTPSGQDTAFFLSSDTNVMYHSDDNGSWCLAPGSNGASGSLVTKPLYPDPNRIAVAATTSVTASGVRIYSNAYAKDCLTDAPDAVTTTACSAANANQVWSMANHQLIGKRGLCLSRLSSKVLGYASCAALGADPNQRWYLARGQIYVEAARAYVDDFGEVLCDGGSGSVRLEYAYLEPNGWSIGARDYF